MRRGGIKGGAIHVDCLQVGVAHPLPKVNIHCNSNGALPTGSECATPTCKPSIEDSTQRSKEETDYY